MGCIDIRSGSFGAVSSSKRSVMIGLGCVELEALEKINQRNLCKVKHANMLRMWENCS